MAMLIWLIGVICLFPGTSSSSSNMTDKCPEHCKCTNEKLTGRYTVICDGKTLQNRMRKIPDIPNKTQELIFINNLLLYWTKAEMPDMSHIYLTHLNLSNNSIAIIDGTAFVSLRYLKVLDLSSNNVFTEKSGCRSFQNISKSLQSLMLNHLYLTPYDMKCMFDSLQHSHISHIELSRSIISHFNGSWLKKLPSITYLDISWNDYQNDQMTLAGLSNLKFLSMVGNLFSDVPDFCRDGVKNLETLFMSNTMIGEQWRRMFSSGRCLTKLETLTINDISLPIVLDNFVYNLPSLKRLSMVQISTRLKNIHQYAFRSSSLNSLSFSRCNGFQFSKEFLRIRYFLPDVFYYCENLMEIDLSHNFVELEVEEIKAIFYPLQKLKSIIFIAIDLTNMPTNFFGRFSQLENITLDKNHITGWSDGEDFFNNVTHLRLLSLRNNKISYLTHTSFPDNVLLTLKHLDLSNNRFTCTCDLFWFSHWIIEKSIDFVDKSTYICDNGTPLLDYHPSNIDCNNFIFIISVSVSGGFSCITITIIIIYCCRWRIRFLLYKIRSRSRSQYRKILDEDGSSYIAYVIYCYNDLGWVKDNLIPKIEIEFGLKLCIPHRDFECGSVFSDEIVDHINSSEIVITILSNGFARDEWCLFQLAVAKCKLSKEGTLSILPILMEEIQFKNMNAAIYTTMNMTSYATWNSNENGQEFFWDKVKNNIISLNC